MGLVSLKKKSIAGVIFILLFLSGIVPGSAESAEKELSWCEGLKGTPFGLCNIYYYGIGCEAESSVASEKVCLQVSERYTQLTGEFMPHEKTPSCLTVNPDDPLYNRFEGTAFDNACLTDTDCIVSGCSNETCSAEEVFSSCEELSRRPTGSCGCINNICQWNDQECL